MYKTKGNLIIKTFNGKYGSFAIGSLETTEGTYEVKQSELEQYEEGTYSGKFVISDIFLSHSNFGGQHKSIIAICATLSSIKLDSADLGPVENVVEQDPIEEAQKTNVAEIDKADEIDTVEEHPLLDAQQLKAFNAKNSVELDPTDRAKLRQCIDFLKDNNYKYDFKNQIWNFNK